MYTAGVVDAEFGARLGDDALAFAHREFGEGFVFEPGDLAPLVVIADPALEGGVATATGITEARLQCRHAERFGAETEAGWLHAQPPATGGMNTTVSPSASGCIQSPNSALIATFSMSFGKVNG